ncbi:sodium/calcium exchanger regulatory protein 1-like [Penaeus chinensis]|uniref:sodium/calcium exchanger regulatory protein 1-like n=1 Tax=Penaeus chinensis TaxID=139456 RepID=UPI001FB8607D|nr:sodium/calcium exchanger regulatory protein 1-like [Penaeus chinensis]
MPNIAGKYTLDSSENFEEFMKALGVGMMLRKLGSSSKPTVELSEENGVWTMKTSTAMKTTEIKFKIGEEVSETTFDGRECKTTFTMEGDKLIQIQKATKGKDCKFTREFTDTQMIMLSECDGVVSKRIYKRQ